MTEYLCTVCPLAESFERRILVPIAKDSSPQQLFAVTRNDYSAHRSRSRAVGTSVARMLITSLTFCSRNIMVASLSPPCYSFRQCIIFRNLPHRLASMSIDATTSTALGLAYGRSTPRIGRQYERSKRQERVGHLVRVELAKILHQKAHAIKYVDDLDESIRQKISVVNANVSPDLRQARISVSILGNDIVEKRQAYSWLVKSTKMIRHALAQELRHMKTVPTLCFVQVDVGAAVDVMELIDKISKDSNYKRKNVGMYGGNDNSPPEGIVMGIDLDEDGVEGWIDEDDYEDEVQT